MADLTNMNVSSIWQPVRNDPRAKIGDAPSVFGRSHQIFAPLLRTHIRIARRMPEPVMVHWSYRYEATKCPFPDKGRDSSQTSLSGQLM